MTWLCAMPHPNAPLYGNRASVNNTYTRNRDPLVLVVTSALMPR